MDDTVPGVPGVVDDDVNLATAEGRGLLDEAGDVGLVHDVAGNGQGAAAVGVDLRGDLGRLGCDPDPSAASSLHAHTHTADEALTGIDVGDDDVGTLVGEEAGGLSADALAGASDDGRLASEETLGVVDGHDDG